MAIAHPASSQAGPQPEPNKKPKNQPELKVDAGTERETASPVAAPPMVPETISRGKKRQGDVVAGPVDEDSGNAPLVIAGVDESQEAETSSASHLLGMSPDDIHTVDAKFHRLLETVHENRPGR